LVLDVATFFAAAMRLPLGALRAVSTFCCATAALQLLFLRGY
jgi:hypothetical protein